MPLHALGDRQSYTADDDVGFEESGFALTLGDQNSDAKAGGVKPAGDGDMFVGVNYRSTLDTTDDEVYVGDQVAVQRDGTIEVNCWGATAYEFGDQIYVDAAGGQDGVCSTTGGGAHVGTVHRHADLSEYAADEYGKVPVDITGSFGTEPEA